MAGVLRLCYDTDLMIWRQAWMDLVFFLLLLSSQRQAGKQVIRRTGWLFRLDLT